MQRPPWRGASAASKACVATDRARLPECVGDQRRDRERRVLARPAAGDDDPAGGGERLGDRGGDQCGRGVAEDRARKPALGLDHLAHHPGGTLAQLGVGVGRPLGPRRALLAHRARLPARGSRGGRSGRGSLSLRSSARPAGMIPDGAPPGAQSPRVERRGSPRWRRSRIASRTTSASRRGRSSAQSTADAPGPRSP